MSSAKPSRCTLLLVVALLSLLIAPTLLWGGDQEKDKKPATSQPAPSGAPKSAAPAGHSTAQPGGSAGARPGGLSAPTKLPTKGGLPANGKSSGAASTRAQAAPPNRKPTQTVQLPGGPASVSRRPNGAVATIHAHGMTISHPLRGPRTVVKEVNGRQIVATGGRRGYVQRAYFSRDGRTYVQRTYVVHGVSYASVYHSYSYRGVVYYGYVPAYYYRPVYYGWAYEPWGAPVAYGPAAWGWGGSPWYGFYGAYFTPYPAYAGASQWLADYLVAANLQAAYDARSQVDASSAAGGAAARNAALSPEVKQMIAEEVRNQLAASKVAASSKATATSADQQPDALNPAERTFVVSSHLDVATATGECGLGPGDVLMRISDAPDANQSVSASVQGSKQADCPVGATVSVGLQDLQEMHNSFRQQLDAGLQTLASNAGKGGLPQAPDTTTIGSEVAAPTPDKNAADQLDSAEQEAESVDKAIPASGGH